MKLHIEKKYLQIGIIAFFVIAAAICFYYLIFHGDKFSDQVNYFFKVLRPVIYGIIIAYLLTPLVNGIESRMLYPLMLRNSSSELTRRSKKGVRAVSIVLTMLLMCLLIYGFFRVLIPNIAVSITTIYYQMPSYVRNLSNWATRFLDDNPDIEEFVLQLLGMYSEEFRGYLNTNILPQMEGLVRSLSAGLISFLGILWNFIIGAIISVYVLFNKELFAGQAKKMVYALLSTHNANSFIRDVRFSSDTFLGFISGKIIDSFIIGCICFAGTSLMRTPYAMLVSVIVGVTNIIPFFGPYLGAIPSAVLILMVDPFKCLYFIIFIVILQQVDGNVIGPKILGESTGLSGFWVLFAITVFGGFMGIPGMIIGVPFFAVLYALVRRIANRLLKKRGLPQETEKYLDVDRIEGNDFIMRDSTQKKTFFKLKFKKTAAGQSSEEQSQNETTKAGE